MTERNADSLYSKYIVAKADGSPVDPKADYFVLRLDTDPAARLAAHCYATEIANEFPALAAELQDKIAWYDFGEPFHQRLADSEQCPECGSRDTATCLTTPDWWRCSDCLNEWESDRHE